MSQETNSVHDPSNVPMHLIDRPVSMTRSVILLSIIGTSLSAMAMMTYGLLVVFKVIVDAFKDRPYDVDHAKHFAIELIELTDLFLFGMALYVVSMGMVQLFLRPDVEVPAWMRVRDLADLKSQLVNVIVVLLAVSFLAVSVSWTSGSDIVYFGLAIGAVVVSLAVYNIAHHITAGAARKLPDSHE